MRWCGRWAFGRWAFGVALGVGTNESLDVTPDAADRQLCSSVDAVGPSDDANQGS